MRQIADVVKRFKKTVSNLRLKRQFFGGHHGGATIMA
uniref:TRANSKETOLASE_1 domain-containing protein n=1 Tax=Heterorhabditis bacteriophora TaxID=37862 RepID=A0A1I7WXN4_HETBA